MVFAPLPTLMAIRLQQGQIWRHGEEFIRLVQLERLTVRYKVVRVLGTHDGPHHEVSKKEFCRLIKSATLLTPAEVARAAKDLPPSAPPPAPVPPACG